MTCRSCATCGFSVVSRRCHARSVSNSWHFLGIVRPATLHRVRLTCGVLNRATLVYPISQQYRWAHVATSGAGLDALMGHTRANVLRAIHIGQTTTQLGRSLNISAASASRHTAVLREAGLITSHRQLSAVLRTLTPLGTALLEQDRTTVL